jgi:hypothetical protein
VARLSQARGHRAGLLQAPLEGRAGQPGGDREQVEEPEHGPRGRRGVTHGGGHAEAEQRDQRQVQRRAARGPAHPAAEQVEPVAWREPAGRQDEQPRGHRGAGRGGGRHHRAAGRRLDLSPKEFGVLECLLAAGGRVVPAEELLDRVWDSAADLFTTAVKTTIRRLRLKLGDQPVIRTVREGGYRIGDG